MACSGRGDCLRQIGVEKYITTECPKKCKPENCPQCNCKLPKWVLDCNKGTCVNCAAENYCKQDKKKDEDPTN